MVRRQFFRKRWLDFRNGHSIYLAYAMAFANFILIAYNFAVKGDKVLGLSLNLTEFTIIFMAVYIPAAMLIGYWHRRNQYSVENEALLQENWVSAWLMRFQFRLVEGKATPEEVKEVMNYLEAIIKRGKREDLLRKIEESAAEQTGKSSS